MQSIKYRSCDRYRCLSGRRRLPSSTPNLPKVLPSIEPTLFLYSRHSIPLPLLSAVCFSVGLRSDTRVYFTPRERRSFSRHSSLSVPQNSQGCVPRAHIPVLNVSSVVSQRSFSV